MKICVCAKYAAIRADLFAAKLSHDAEAGNRLIARVRRSNSPVLRTPTRYDLVVPVPPRVGTKSQDLAVGFARVVRDRLRTPSGRVLEQSRCGCYTMVGFLAEGETVLLIDGVTMTGSRLRECERVLKAHGAGRVDALVVARVPR